MTASRDTTIGMLGAAPAIVDGATFLSSSVELGGQRATTGIGVRGLLEVEFDVSTNGNENSMLSYAGHTRYEGQAVPAGVNSITSARLDMLDSGTALEVVFRNLPHGSEVGPEIDCANLLPCSWSSRDNDTTIVLESLEVPDGPPTVRTRQLTLNFTMESERAMLIGFGDATSIATGSGTIYRAGAAFLAGSGSGLANGVFVELESGLPTPGEILFGVRPTDTEAERLLFNVFESSSPRVPRWNPVFRNVPMTP